MLVLGLALVSYPSYAGLNIDNMKINIDGAFCAAVYQIMITSYPGGNITDIDVYFICDDRKARKLRYPVIPVIGK